MNISPTGEAAISLPPGAEPAVTLVAAQTVAEVPAPIVVAENRASRAGGWW